jgi:hypothetical protein
VKETIRSDKLSVKDKENINPSLLWQAKELDKKFNIPYEGSLMRVIYEGDRRNISIYLTRQFSSCSHRGFI